MTLIGADRGLFNDIVVAFHEIQDLFALEFAEGALIRADQQNVDGELGLTFSTRYFTPMHLAKNDIDMSLGLGVDPAGLLRSRVGNKGRHLEANRVDYMRWNGAGRQNK